MAAAAAAAAAAAGRRWGCSASAGACSGGDRWVLAGFVTMRMNPINAWMMDDCRKYGSTVRHVSGVHADSRAAYRGTGVGFRIGAVADSESTSVIIFVFNDIRGRPGRVLDAGTK